MRRTLTASVWIVVMLIAAVFGGWVFFSSVREKTDIIQSMEERQLVAKAGMDYLLGLRLEGRLPGVTTNEHGNAGISGRLTRHPYSLTMQFGTEGGASTNHYNIVQIKKGSPWQLTRAWRTDSNGQILQEWSVN